MPVGGQLPPFCGNVRIEVIPVHLAVFCKDVQQVFRQFIDVLEYSRSINIPGAFSHDPADQLRKAVHSIIPGQYARQNAEHRFLRDSLTHLHSPHS